MEKLLNHWLSSFMNAATSWAKGDYPDYHLGKVHAYYQTICSLASNLYGPVSPQYTKLEEELSAVFLSREWR